MFVQVQIETIKKKKKMFWNNFKVEWIYVFRWQFALKVNVLLLYQVILLWLNLYFHPFGWLLLQLAYALSDAAKPFLLLLSKQKEKTVSQKADLKNQSYHY